MSFDWSMFTVRVNIRNNKRDIYPLWATRSGIEYWFLRTGEYKKPDGSLRADDEPVQVGDSLKWLWHGYGDEVAEFGEILEANGKNVLKFRFGKAGICTVKISNEGEQGFVELTQSAIPVDERGKENYHVGCKTGWTFHLSNLKSILEGGIDLRNKDISIKNVINA